MTTALNVYNAGETLPGTNLTLNYIQLTTPHGPLRMTSEEATTLGHQLLAAADYEHRTNLTDEDATNPYLDPYPWNTHPALTVTVHGLPGPQGSKTPIGYGRSRTTGKTIPLMRESSTKVKPWRDKVQTAITAALHTSAPLAGPVYAHITFTMPKPVRAPKRRRTYPAVTPDIDKLERSTYDAITKAAAWKDDGCVIESHARKTYPGEHPDALDQPGALIRLYTLGDPS
ncbi:RusA family crossover junction endodeoxyribonuclease [Streptomyces albidoflavus]